MWKKITLISWKRFRLQPCIAHMFARSQAAIWLDNDEEFSVVLLFYAWKKDLRTRDTRIKGFLWYPFSASLFSPDSYLLHIINWRLSKKWAMLSPHRVTVTGSLGVNESWALTQIGIIRFDHLSRSRKKASRISRYIRWIDDTMWQQINSKDYSDGTTEKEESE